MTTLPCYKIPYLTPWPCEETSGLYHIISDNQEKCGTAAMTLLDRRVRELRETAVSVDEDAIVARKVVGEDDLV